MLRKVVLSLFVLAACIAVSQTAYAFPVSGVANYTTPIWSADVNWEVYAPGITANGLAGDTDWHYFYYITRTDPNNATELHFFSVGNPGGATINNWGNIDRGAGTPAPDFVSPVLPDDALFAMFITDGIGVGESSDWLYFTTPQAPQWVYGGLANGGPNNYQQVPGPVPEPASIAMLGFGLVGLLGTAKKRFKA